MTSTAPEVGEGVPAPANLDATARVARDRTNATVRKRMIRTVQAVVALFLLNYIAVPQLAGLRRAVTRLSEVNGVMLVAGLGFQFAALLAYSQFTRAALSPHEIRLATVLRVQMSTKAVTNLVPGGSAAGSALGYRLLTLAGVDSAGAGFALATAGLGSAVVLNLLLWLTLLVSIPLSGVNPVYVTTALVGIFLLGAFGAVVVLLVKGADRAERIVRSLARHFSFLDPERVSGIMRRFGERIRSLGAHPALLRKLVFWSSLNWLLDAASLWMFLRAFGEWVRPDSLLVAFCVANVSAAIPLTPGGLGVLDLALSSMLAFFGVAATTVTLGVPAYRLAAFWLPIPLGALAYLSLRLGPWRIDRQRALASLRDEAASVLRTGETVYDWADRVGVPRVAAAAVAADAAGDVVILADRAQPGSVRGAPVTTPPAAAPTPAPIAEVAAPSERADPPEP